MIKTIHLEPHDPIPDGRHVVVIRRFDEDDPDLEVVQIVLTGRSGQVAQPSRPDGSPMPMDEAIAAARVVAEQEGIPEVHVIDRLAGPRERDILQHAGDHSVHMDSLSDTDVEDGEKGADMRDLAHPARG